MLTSSKMMKEIVLARMAVSYMLVHSVNEGAGPIGPSVTALRRH